MNTYRFEHDGKTITIEARTRRTAERRLRGLLRGELDVDGKTILAKKRTPPGRSMRKKDKGEA
jgi:hypothetical protein